MLVQGKSVQQTDQDAHPPSQPALTLQEAGTHARRRTTFGTKPQACARNWLQTQLAPPVRKCWALPTTGERTEQQAQGRGIFMVACKMWPAPSADARRRGQQKDSHMAALDAAQSRARSPDSPARVL